MAGSSPNTLAAVADELVSELEPLKFGAPVAYVYNPLQYARRSYRKYLSKYGKGRKEVVFLGMNPGPFGMVQTGVPFGDVGMVRDWLGIREKVERPAKEHPKRPVEGFDCSRSEVSGARFWGWARDTFKTPDRFFARFFVANYCPLAFLEQGGRNRTPDKLPAKEKKPLTQACDRALLRTVKLLRPDRVIGIGRFAEKRALTVLKTQNVEVGRILHPSPASPLANRGWADAIIKELHEQGVRF